MPCLGLHCIVLTIVGRDLLPGRRNGADDLVFVEGIGCSILGAFSNDHEDPCCWTSVVNRTVGMFSVDKAAHFSLYL